MIKAISIGLLLILSINPVLAQDIPSLLAEREKILNQINSGSASDSDVFRFEDLCKQINDATARKVKENSDRVNSINNGLKRLEDQQNRVYNSLFGKLPSGNNSSNLRENQSNTPVREEIPAPECRAKQEILKGAVVDLGLVSLMQVAVANNPEYRANASVITKLSTTYEKALAEGKDAVNYLLPYRGFGPSQEGSDIILGKDTKNKSLAAALYSRQKIIDETHLKVVSNILEMAMGIGANDSGLTTESTDNLKKLVGDQATQHLYEDMQNFGGTPREANWDVLGKQDRYRKLLKNVIERDQIVQDTVKSVNKYQRSKTMMLVSHIVEPVLAGASLLPSLIGPAARISLLEFVYSTGGSEQDKLLKELYLDKRLQSRVSTIAEESHMVLDSLQIAYLTKNQTLSAVSESLIEEMLQDKTNEVLE